MATSLLDWIMNLLTNDDAREAFQADPKNAMAAAGMSSVCSSDVRDSRAFLVDHPHVRETNHFRPAAQEAPAHEHVSHILNHYTAGITNAKVSYDGLAIVFSSSAPSWIPASSTAVATTWTTPSTVTRTTVSIGRSPT